MSKYLTTGWTVFENNIWNADEVMKEYLDDVSVTWLLFEDPSEYHQQQRRITSVWTQSTRSNNKYNFLLVLSIKQLLAGKIGCYRLPYYVHDCKLGWTAAEDHSDQIGEGVLISGN